MPYVGKSPDLNASVDTNELADDAVTLGKIGEDVKTAISGSFVAKADKSAISGSFVAKADKSAISGSVVSGVSGSSISTGSFGRVEVAGNLTVTGASPTPDQAADGWRGGLSDESNGGNIDIDSDMIIDYDDYSDGENFLGTAHSESAGAITIGTAGWYLILVAAHKSNDVIDTMDVSIRKNSIDVAGRLYGAGWDEVNYASGGIACAVMELAVNDTVDVYGKGYFYSQNNAYWQMCWWCGIRLCD
jgi:hypothetical protein